MLKFETNVRAFSGSVARRQALRFTEARFEEELLGYLAGVLHSKAPSLAA
jgi:hypothetical protein